MAANDQEYIGKRAISRANFSRAFCDAAGVMGFGALADILSLKPAELVLRPGFSYHWLAELSAFLEANQCLELWQGLSRTENISG